MGRTEKVLLNIDNKQKGSEWKIKGKINSGGQVRSGREKLKGRVVCEGI